MINWFILRFSPGIAIPYRYAPNCFTKLHDTIINVVCAVVVTVEQVEADIPNNKLWVTSEKSAGQLVEALTKTGKKVLYIGPATN